MNQVSQSGAPARNIFSLCPGVQTSAPPPSPAARCCSHIYSNIFQKFGIRNPLAVFVRALPPRLARPARPPHRLLEGRGGTAGWPVPVVPLARPCWVLAAPSPSPSPAPAPAPAPRACQCLSCSTRPERRSSSPTRRQDACAAASWRRSAAAGSLQRRIAASLSPQRRQVRAGCLPPSGGVPA